MHTNKMFILSGGEWLQNYFAYINGAWPLHDDHRHSSRSFNFNMYFLSC